jgi:hypothetical protein
MPEISGSTVTRTHDDYTVWSLDQARTRASYIATRRHLARYLVPHRFEDAENVKPEKLDRALLGYGLGLNKAWLYEIFGHVRSAGRLYDWGSLGGSTDDEASPGKPAENSAGYLLWNDATRDNRTWTNFFHRDVLEWMLTSPGALIICDVVPGEAATKGEAKDRGVRPYVSLVPLSALEDCGRGPTGFEWVKIKEFVDNRNPFNDDGEVEEYRVYYWLDDQGETWVARYALDGTPQTFETRNGEEVAELSLGKLVDRQGAPTLPVVEAFFGEHPDIPWIGSGLLLGLDEIVIDLYNTITEIREGYRDAAFALWVYRGQNFDEVEGQFKGGSRLAHVGDVETDDLTRVAGDGSEVEAGMSVIEFGLRAWAVSAKRKAEEATERASSARSGISLQAEFQLDLRPLLAEVASALDEVESMAMLILAQLADESATDATIGV